MGVAFVVLLLGARDVLGGAPRIEVLTMGPGDDAFSRFGHAAICVDRTCYNYGTADFSTPVPLSYDFLRGRAEFWVSVSSRERMMRVYRRQDRTVYRQILPLSDEQAQELARRLAHDAKPENRFYTYHHFADNCTTRIRDHLDAATGGGLAAARERPHDSTYRQLVRDGFSSDWLLVALGEVVLGRDVERVPTVWEAMLLPKVLRAEIERSFFVKPERLYQRKQPLQKHSRQAGQLALLLVAALLALVVAVSQVRRRPVAERVGLVVVGLVLGLFALLVDGLAIVSVHRDLWKNELLLVFLPTDFLLIGLRGKRLRGYVVLRTIGLALVALAALVGMFIQPLWPPLAVAFAAFATIAAFQRKGAKERDRVDDFVK